VGDIILLVEAYELVSHGVAYIQKEVQVALRSLRANFDIFRENKLHKARPLKQTASKAHNDRPFPSVFHTTSEQNWMVRRLGPRLDGPQS